MLMLIFVQSADPDGTLVQMLCKSKYFLLYCDAVMMEERVCLNNPHIFTFFHNIFPKVGLLTEKQTLEAFFISHMYGI